MQNFFLNDLTFLKFGPLHPWWARSKMRPPQGLSPPAGAKVIQGVAVFNLFLNGVIKLAIVTAVAGSHIVGCFLPHMGTVGTVPLTHPNHPPHKGHCRCHQSDNEGNPRPGLASSSRSWNSHRSDAFSPLPLSSLSF